MLRRCFVQDWKLLSAPRGRSRQATGETQRGRLYSVRERTGVICEQVGVRGVVLLPVAALQVDKEAEGYDKVGERHKDERGEVDHVGEHIGYVEQRQRNHPREEHPPHEAHPR